MNTIEQLIQRLAEGLYNTHIESTQAHPTALVFDILDTDCADCAVFYGVVDISLCDPNTTIVIFDFSPKTAREVHQEMHKKLDALDSEFETVDGISPGEYASRSAEITTAEARQIARDVINRIADAAENPTHPEALVSACERLAMTLGTDVTQLPLSATWAAGMAAMALVSSAAVWAV